MKIYSKKKITEEKNVLDRIQCDFCKNQTNNDSNWDGDSFAIRETEIRFKDGVSYPEFGHGTEITVDMCPDCFEKKLIPWIESNGVKMNTKDWDW